MSHHLLEPITEALTHDLSYDPQCEDGREEYLIELADAAGGLARFRLSILDALQRATRYADVSQLFTLCRHLAMQGDDEARLAMYRVFRKSLSIMREGDWPGVLDIIELDGRNGLLEIAKAYGERIAGDDTYIANDIRWFRNDVFDEGEIERALISMAEYEPLVRLYVQQLQQPTKDTQRVRLAESDLRAMTLDEILAVRPSAGLFVLRRWGRVASLDELKKAADRLSSVDDAEMVRDLLWCFWYREYPFDPKSVLSIFGRFDDERATRAAEVVLQRKKSVEVRTVAVDLIQSSRNVCRGLALLCANYQSGDGAIISNALRETELSMDDRHDAGMWLLDMYDEQLSHDDPDPMLWTYENTPCSNCRGNAFEILDQAGRAPSWMYEELRADCNMSNRELVSGIES